MIKDDHLVISENTEKTTQTYNLARNFIGRNTRELNRFIFIEMAGFGF